MQTRLFLLYKE